MTLNSVKNKIDHMNDFHLSGKLRIEIKKQTSDKFRRTRLFNSQQVNRVKDMVYNDINLSR